MHGEDQLTEGRVKGYAIWMISLETKQCLVQVGFALTEEAAATQYDLLISWGFLGQIRKVYV